MNTCSRTPATPIHLSPEQMEHEHVNLHWDWQRDIFVCAGTEDDPGCGAEFVIPELSEVMRLSVASE
jgi:hypothetical protein